MAVNFLVHAEGDSVGVAVEDISAGSLVRGALKDGVGELEVLVTDRVPLGHKLALRELANGEEVVEYGVVIGRATADIGVGQGVHTHNLKGQRWS